MVLDQIVTYGLQIIGGRRSPTKPHRRKCLVRRIRGRSASTLEHTLNTGVHFFLFNEFAARDLVETQLNLLLEPLVMSKQPGNRLLHKIVGGSSSRDR